MARQSPGRRNTEEHAAEALGDKIVETPEPEAQDAAGAPEPAAGDDTAATGPDSPDDTAATGPDSPDDTNSDSHEDDTGGDSDASRAPSEPSPLWAEVGIEPIEIALPAGCGFTLRAYRRSGGLTPTEVVDRDTDDPFAQRMRLRQATALEDLDEFDDAGDSADDSADDGSATPSSKATTAGARKRRADDDGPAKDTTDKEATDSGDKDDDGSASQTTVDAEDELAERFADVEDEEAEQEGDPDEEVPVFLTHRGQLLLFRSTESLVSFVRSGAPNDLTQLDSWSELVERVEPDDVAPSDGDSYELDLVVENLRGGHDAWDVHLLIKAGEVARDLGYALRLEPVLTALASGSPLDDLDEALRRTADGGLGGFLGRRRLRKIGAQQATLGWRTIIGKISGAVDWRD